MPIYMTDQELLETLWEYDEYGFEGLPNWLQRELKARQIPTITREASIIERNETDQDGFEHRYFNNELTISDYLEIQKGKHV